ncbi:hypothetical protein GALMADRAFT_233206 [Galerina marginata CBS 339.88]|uniref:Uncharacterized protein n=1 Tax=Galerina marginata (strain CBS 339.88) TaxID=685588 RepID=A0A067TNQ3_GALM3|nr:hypothetical protein GALMADRAFT_233206 [Galerina marginata CBS 339.88]
MNTAPSHHHSHQESSSSMQRHPSDEIRRLVSSAHSVLEQTPPPSLREILSAYRTKGDGDRDMLLAMLNAKTAEDQRLASVTSLHRTMFEIYQHSPQASEHSSSRPITNGAYHYPTPTFSQPSRSYEQPQSRDSRRVHHRHRVTSGSRSPPPSRMHSQLQPTRDIPISHHSEHPRKRHRSSHSPHLSHAGVYESHPSEQFPPSPYSSSDRSDSAEYSPRSRTSMTIGSLLSSGPGREINGDIPLQERD